MLTLLNWCLLRSQRKVPRYIDSVACVCSFESPGLSNVAGGKTNKEANSNIIYHVDVNMDRVLFKEISGQ